MLGVSGKRTLRGMTAVFGHSAMAGVSGGATAVRFRPNLQRFLELVPRNLIFIWHRV